MSRFGEPELGPGSHRVLLVIAEVPGDEDVLALGVAVDALPVAPKLRVMGREEHQARVHPVPEGLDQVRIAETRPDLPVRSSRSEVDNLDITDRRLRREFLGAVAPRAGGARRGCCARPA